MGHGVVHLGRFPFEKIEPSLRAIQATLTDGENLMQRSHSYLLRANGKIETSAGTDPATDVLRARFHQRIIGETRDFFRKVRPGVEPSAVLSRISYYLPGEPGNYALNWHADPDDMALVAFGGVAKTEIQVGSHVFGLRNGSLYEIPKGVVHRTGPTLQEGWRPFIAIIY